MLRFLGRKDPDMNKRIYETMHLSDEKIQKLLFIFILILGIGARLWMSGDVPGGINQDEAFAAREAWSLLHYGKDSFGYSCPMYLMAWGSGMSALNTYLMIPFIALFGMHTWVFRLPQMLIGILSLFAIEEIVSKVSNWRCSLLAMFLLAISPWHIMLSRWALDCNLVVGFLLFGLLFFIYGTEKQPFFILSAVFYGLSLYCYAAIWPIVPIIILLQGLYLLYVHKVKITRYIVIAVITFILFAIPILLFYLVNMDILPEIVTPWFSVPRLIYFRGSDFSILDIPGKFNTLLQLLLTEKDDCYWNSTTEFGLYYKYGLVFTVTGFAVCVKRTWKSLKDHTYHGYTFFMIQFLLAVILGMLIHVNVNRINSIHTWVLIFMAIGIEQYIRLFKKIFPHIDVVIAALYLVAFISFEHFYFTTYADNISQYFKKGIEPAVLYAENQHDAGQSIHVGDSFNYEQILVFSTITPDEYKASVEYTNYPAAFLDISQCQNYIFHSYPTGENGIYLFYGLSEEDKTNYEQLGYQVTRFDTVSVLEK